MEKIRTFKASSDGWHHVDAYRASDVDALLSDVRALVDAAIDARELMETLPTLHGFIGLAVLEELKQAIAAVERHL